jgi:hypothetical protein
MNLSISNALPLLESWVKKETGTYLKARLRLYEYDTHGAWRRFPAAQSFCIAAARAEPD